MSLVPASTVGTDIQPDSFSFQAVTLCSPTSSQVVSDGLGEEQGAVLSLTVGNPPRTLVKIWAIHTPSIFRRLLFPHIDNS